MRAIRGCRHYFFCAAWDRQGPWPPRHPGAPGRKTPRGTPPRWTRAPAARGEKVVRFRHHRASEAETQTWACRSQRPQGGAANLAATLRGRPLRSDGVLVRCRVLAPERLDTSCTCRTMQTRTCGTCTCGWGLQRSPKKRASAACVFPNRARCKEAPGRGHVRRVPKVPRFGGAGGCWEEEASMPWF